MKSRTYDSPAAFKQALEDHLRKEALKREHPIERQRELLVFHRFLARVEAKLGPEVTLKGGLVLELRVARARATKDIDLRVQGDPGRLLIQLQDAARIDLGDFFVFDVRSNEEHSRIQNEGMRYEGLRFRVESRLAQKLYSRPFDVDVAFGEPMLGTPAEVTAPNVLGFAGIAPPRLRLYPIETHLAEKLHAYTMPRWSPNSRVKDLPDIPLLASTGALDASRLRSAIHQTFTFRDTHPPPLMIPPPSPAWEKPYTDMAQDNQLPWATLEKVTEAAKRFLDPVLEGAAITTWDPETWSWNR
ncbi:nucleotidyl transferase AbiEii/AbiGii toxin family protein [Corallococcus exiguus]|uniref:nucleotidyl transferase AbiEii/AbiGii toxin family protein n=1 Tax=Corallococcus TaxID=83461 RepID=UPI000EA1A997|nr:MULTISPECIES: nucleotidyl transferase AbiEii/AbiGii toxin family protein [unclassified Corallococcus]NRD55015.1 nucleotidyl transferase AbiEii/AbiGii toxin family protein [Corallococcus exiguus]NRD65260.1 nucleotidyl transferase AbiEii/AbiGii toxin family protein [Corallococcus exiguus]RKH26043.1 nucleotidyl transferase AbiEii/AbiGii toxin family protein [Corallococcus sp. CA041A]RUO93801.1 nucleotidyl transferase AbiEii/AbiGii toxin family protein [Corallococcus sp. AB018]